MRLCSIFLVSASFCLPFASALAQVDPATSLIPECMTLSPGPRYAGNPIGGYRVVVNDALGAPVAGAEVTVTFTAGAAPLIAWCGGGGPPLLTGFTAADGSIMFDILGAGCIDPLEATQACAIPAANVDVVGPGGVGGAFTVPISCVRSPDVVNETTAQLPSCPGTNTCNNGRTSINLSDLVYHTYPIKVQAPDPCTKITPPWDGGVGLTDFVYLTPYFRAPAGCGCS